MKKKILRAPSAGVVLGTLALIVAIAGNSGAFAGTKVIVRKGQIAKGAVTADALAKGAVTARALAKGSVHPAALAEGVSEAPTTIAPGSVGAAAIKPGAVGTEALAADAVTAPAIAPGSIYGGALQEVTVHTAPIVDADVVPDNGEWTASSPAVASCGTGERVLSGGVVFTNTGDKEVGTIISQPFVNGGGNGWVGAITTNAGGAAKAEVQALCLK
jgi:hypothetical protein